ncbi:MAG: nucleotidyltransferase domain-containing protein [bacterium]
MDRSEAVGLIKKFVAERLPQEDWYQVIQSEIKAVIFYGSRAKESNRPDSDIDILLIVPLSVEQAHTEGEYVFEYDGWKINIVLRSIEKLRKLAEAGDDEFQREVFRKSEIIWESDGEVRELLTKI